MSKVEIFCGHIDGAQYGPVMDVMHRVAKVALQGRLEIEAAWFDEDPEQDYVGLGPDELTY